MPTPYIKKKKQKWIDNAIAIIILIMTILLITGCAKQQPASETIANSAQESLNAVTATLPKDCKSDAVTAQINAAKTAINATVTACNNEKDIINSDKRKYQLLFFGLLILILANTARKVLK
jgi:hypothetical protein